MDVRSVLDWDTGELARPASVLQDGQGVARPRRARPGSCHGQDPAGQEDHDHSTIGVVIGNSLVDKMNLEIVKSYLVGTSLGDLAKRLRWVMTAPQRKRHPDCPSSIWRAIASTLDGRLIHDRPIASTSAVTRLHPRPVRETGTAGHHMAFEPVPWKARRLTRKFPGVAVRQMALGDTAARSRSRLTWTDRALAD